MKSRSKSLARCLMFVTAFAGMLVPASAAENDALHGPYVSSGAGFSTLSCPLTVKCAQNDRIWILDGLDFVDKLGINGIFLSTMSVIVPEEGKLGSAAGISMYRETHAEITLDNGLGFYGLAGLRSQPSLEPLSFDGIGSGRYYGAGLRFGIKDNWVLNLEYTKSATDLDNAWLWLSYSP